MNKNSEEILKNLIEKYPALISCESAIESAVLQLLATIGQDGIIYTCGNGGSASDSEHIVGELMKSFRIRRQLSSKSKEAIRNVTLSQLDDVAENLANHLEEGVRAVSLVSQMALSSAIYNDIGVDYVFAQQVYSYGRAGDTLIVISTSGNSKNCIYAAVAAKARGVKVVALTGENTGKLESHCDITIKAPAMLTLEIQELHLPIYHAICGMVEAEAFS